jgi:hypothetical protein
LGPKELALRSIPTPSQTSYTKRTSRTRACAGNARVRDPIMKHVHRIVSLVLVCALAVDPHLSVIPFSVRDLSGHLHLSSLNIDTAPFQEQALSSRLFASRNLFSHVHQFLTVAHEWHGYRPQTKPQHQLSLREWVPGTLLLGLAGWMLYYGFYTGGGMTIASAFQVMFGHMQIPDTDGNVLVEAAKTASAKIYGDRRMPSGEKYVDYCSRLERNYLNFCEQANIKPDSYIVTAASLFFTNDAERRKELRESLSHNDIKKLAVIERVQTASKLPYNPPTKVAAIEPQNVPHQMGMAGKFSDSFDELLLLVAKIMTTLETPSTPPATKEKLYQMMNQVYVPLLYRMGARSLSTKLSDEIFRLAHPARYAELEAAISQRLGMDRERARQYERDTIMEIRKDLPKSLKENIFGELKSISSVDRKLNAKPEEYPDVSSIQDLIRIAIVLNKPEDLDEVTAAVGEHFTGTTGKTELKELPGYKAYHISFEKEVNGQMLSHEFQIFLSEQEYFRYNYGWPNAWWAYATEQVTGQRPQFEMFPFKEKDPRSNFTNFKAAIEPWTYPYESLLQGNEIKLVARRIPNTQIAEINPKNGGKHRKNRNEKNDKNIREKIARGNVADIAALSNHLKENVPGAWAYHLEYDPDKFPDEQWAQLNRHSVGLGHIVEDGEVIKLSEGPTSKADYLHARETAGSLKAFMELDSLIDPRRYEIYRQKGEKALLGFLEGSFDRSLQSQKYSTAQHEKKKYPKVEITDYYRNEILKDLAIKNNLAGADQLLAAFVYPVPEVMVPEQNVLWMKMSHATLMRGTGVLIDNHVAVNQKLIISKLDAVAHDAFSVKDAKGIIMAVAAGLIPVKNVADALLRFDRRSSGIFSSGSLPTPLLQSEVVTLLCDYKDLPDRYEVNILMNHDQPGLLGIITSPTISQKVNLAGVDFERSADGIHIRLVIDKKRNSDIDIDSFMKDLESLKIERIPQDTSVIRIPRTIHFSLQDVPGAFHKLAVQLGKGGRKDGINIDSARNKAESEEQRQWFDMDVMIPERPGRAPEQTLNEALISLTENGKPLVEKLEFMKTISPATADALKKKVSDKKEDLKGAGWEIEVLTSIWRFIEPIVSSEKKPLNQEDQADIRHFETAMKYTEELYKREVRRSKKHPPYEVHVYGVLLRLLKWGVLDISVLIAALGHDMFENFPEKSDDIRTWIKASFPLISNQIIHNIEYVTYYKQKTSRYVDYIRNLTARGMIDLLALKLADMLDNLESIFDVKDDPNFAKNQIAKRIRNGLPLVSWETYLKNDVYVNSRRDFLEMLIRQSARLIDEQKEGAFYRTYAEPGEDEAQVRREVVDSIQSYLDWADRNTVILPVKAVGQTAVNDFHTHLRELARRLRQVSPRFTPSPAGTIQAPPIARTSA